LLGSIARPALALAFLLLGAGPAGAAAAPQCEGISPVRGTALAAVRVAAGLQRPLLALSPAKDLERLFIVEQDGKIKILKNGILNAAPFLDIGALTDSPSDGGDTNEQGLLGLAFDPDYVDNGIFYVYHTDVAGQHNLVVRYERNGANPDEADAASRQVLLTLDHSSFTNHNGGMIAFGPNDGYLYIATGDGGDFCDPFDYGQDLSSPLGKILRIDVSTAFPYSIPPDNPFVDTPGALPEVYEYGLRNPYRFSFDSANGDLYIGDVGQNLYEEIDYVPAAAAAGRNFGWDFFEGVHCPNPSCASEENCAPDDYVAPIHEYEHDGSCSITGGYVYRGCRLPDLHGTYFYGDFCAAFVHSFRVTGGAMTGFQDRTAELAPGGGLALQQITSFGQDARGEVYVIDRGFAFQGEVYRIVPVFTALETSGTGATAFRPGDTEWTWEDVRATTGYPVVAYRVYRTESYTTPYACVFRGENPAWPGGDPASPAPGVLHSYVVVAELADGRKTSPGSASAGTERTLSAAACP